MDIIKTIRYRLSDEEYAHIRGILEKDEKTLEETLPDNGDPVQKILYQFLPEATAQGLSSNIEVYIVKIPGIHDRPKRYCHLNIIEDNGFRFAKILDESHIDKNTGKLKKYVNDTFSTTYEVTFA